MQLKEYLDGNRYSKVLDFIITLFIPACYCMCLFGSVRIKSFLLLAFGSIFVFCYLLSQKKWNQIINLKSAFFWGLVAALLSTAFAYLFNPNKGLLLESFPILGTYKDFLRQDIQFAGLIHFALLFFLTSLLFKYNRKLYDCCAKIVAVIILVCALSGIVNYVLLVINANMILVDKSCFDNTLVNALPAGTAMLFGLLLPVFSDRKKSVFVKLIFFVAILTTFNRSTYIALFFALVLFVILNWKTIPKKVLLPMLFSVLLVFTVFFVFLMAKRVGISESDGIRFALLRNAKAMMHKADVFLTLFGHGFESFDVDFEARTGMKFGSENAYMSILYEEGLVGFSLTVLLLLKVFLFYFFDKSKDKGLNWYALAALAVSATLLFYGGEGDFSVQYLLALTLTPFVCTKIEGFDETLLRRLNCAAVAFSFLAFYIFIYI